MMENPFAKKEEVYGFQTFYRELGYYLYRLEHYEQIVQKFDYTLQRNSDDKRALLGRSKAKAKVLDIKGALKDITTALKIDEDDLNLLAQKALETYLDGEFEDGLIQNQIMVVKRKKPDSFEMGIRHCMDAIENCLGERCGRPLRDHFKIIRKIAWENSYKSKETQLKPRKATTHRKAKQKMQKGMKELSRKQKTVHVENEPIIIASKFGDCPPGFDIIDSLHSDEDAIKYIPPCKKDFPYRPLQAHTDNIDNFMAAKYLDSMYKDKIFLKNLITDKGLKSPNQQGSKELKRLAVSSFKAICQRQEMLRTRRPMYLIKYQEGKSSESLKIRQKKELEDMQNLCRKDIDAQMFKVQRALEGNNVHIMLHLEAKIRAYCDTKSKKLIPDRDTYLQQVYKYIGQAYFNMKRINKKQYPWDQVKRIYVMLGLELSREPSQDSVIKEYKDVFIDYRQQIDKYQKRLAKSSCPEETVWLYHELASFHLKLRHFEISRVYARKCINEGRIQQNLQWCINGIILLVKQHILQKNKTEAKNELLRATDVAREMDDSDLEEFMNKAMDVVNNADIGTGTALKMLQKREQHILTLLGQDQMKAEAAHMFKVMSTLPAHRRMSVLPGVQITDSEKPSGGGAARLSIMPTAPVEEAPNFSKKSKKDEGAQFAEMIQYNI